MQEVDDWMLAARARRGDQEAFTALVRRYQTPVIRFCSRMIGNSVDAEDVAQECFLSLFRSLDRLEPRARFSTFLFGIARNLTLNFLRDGRRRGRHTAQPLEAMTVEPGSHQQPDNSAQAVEWGELIRDALLRLSPEHREIILLREYEQMDYEEIAGILKCPMGTVRSRLARAREALREQLVGLGVEP